MLQRFNTGRGRDVPFSVSCSHEVWTKRLIPQEWYIGEIEPEQAGRSKVYDRAFMMSVSDKLKDIPLKEEIAKELEKFKAKKHPLYDLFGREYLPLEIDPRKTHTGNRQLFVSNWHPTTRRNPRSNAGGQKQKPFYKSMKSHYAQTETTTVAQSSSMKSPSEDRKLQVSSLSAPETPMHLMGLAIDAISRCSAYIEKSNALISQLIERVDQLNDRVTRVEEKIIT